MSFQNADSTERLELGSRDLSHPSLEVGRMGDPMDLGGPEGPRASGSDDGTPSCPRDHPPLSLIPSSNQSLALLTLPPKLKQRAVPRDGGPPGWVSCSLRAEV